MRVVIMSPNGLFDGASLPRLGVDASVVLVSFAPVDDVSAIVLQRHRGLSERVVRAMSRRTVGREVLRLTPLDPGVRFRRAARRDARVHQALANADLIVAPERDGALAAWYAARDAARADRDTVTTFGYPAARAALDRINA